MDIFKKVLREIDDFGLSFEGAFQTVNEEHYNNSLTAKDRNEVKELYSKYLDKERVEALKTKNEAKFTYIIECIKEIQ